MVLQECRKWLQDQDYKIVMRGANNVGVLGVHGKDAVPDLIAATKRAPLANPLEEFHFKVSLMQAFLGLGPVAKEALPTLEKLAETADPATLRFHVMGTIKSIRAEK